MSDLFGGTSTPQWESMDKFSLASEHAAASIGQAFGSAFNAAASRKQQGQFDKKVQMAEDAQKRAAFEREQTGYRMMGIANELKDAKTPGAAWGKVSEHPEWLLDPTTGPLVGKYLSTQAQLATAEKQTIAGKIAIDDSTSFLKGLGAIAPEDRAAIQSMKKNPDGSFSAMQWQALSLSQQTMKAQRENEALIAGNEALSRGDQTTTSINGKGDISMTYKPAQASSGVDNAPLEKVFPNGDIARYNPKGGGFTMVKKDGTEKPFSNSELIALHKDKGLTDQFRNKLGSTIEEKLNKAQGTNGVSTTSSNPFKSAEEVKSAFTSGQLSKEEATKILKSQFGYQ